MQISLKELLPENIENRVTLTRVDAILEKLGPTLDTGNQKKLAGAYAELREFVGVINAIPHTKFSNEHWQLLKIMLMGKVAEMLIVVDDINSDSCNCNTLKQALEGILTY